MLRALGQPMTAIQFDRVGALPSRGDHFCQTGNMESSDAATAFAALSVDTRLNLMRMLMDTGA